MDLRRQSLFISYASQDIALAEWLTRKLMFAGYDAWLDRWRLGGGDDWSKEITGILAERTFCVIHLLSRYSLHDSYAAHERARACDIGRERGGQLLIPLLLEPLRRTELPVELASTVGIPFEDWGQGFAHLVKRLEGIGAPKIDSDAPDLVHGSDYQAQVIAAEPERLYSNAFLVEGVPLVLHHYRVRFGLSGRERFDLHKAWPHWQPYGTQDAFSFTELPHSLQKDIGFKHEPSVLWQERDKVAKQPTSNIVPALIRKSFQQHCHGLGLKYFRLAIPGHKDARTAGWLYFPRGLVPNDKLRVENWSGKPVPIKLIGERTYKGEPFFAHLAFSPVLEQIDRDQFLLFLQLGVRPFQPSGEPYHGTAVGPRVKQATRGWTNAHLLARLRVVVSVLSGGKEDIFLGPPSQSRIALRQLSGEIDYSVDERALKALGAEAASGDAMLEVDEL
jgi:hypothetical protein